MIERSSVFESPAPQRSEADLGSFSNLALRKEPRCHTDLTCEKVALMRIASKLSEIVLNLFLVSPMKIWTSIIPFGHNASDSHRNVYNQVRFVDHHIYTTVALICYSASFYTDCSLS